MNRSSSKLDALFTIAGPLSTSLELRMSSISERLGVPVVGPPADQRAAPPSLSGALTLTSEINDWIALMPASRRN